MPYHCHRAMRARYLFCAYNRELEGQYEDLYGLWLCVLCGILLVIKPEMLFYIAIKERKFCLFVEGVTISPVSVEEALYLSKICKTAFIILKTQFLLLYVRLLN